MRLYWMHILQRRSYRKADKFGRRMIELRFALARTLRAERRKARVSQRRLAYLMDAAQSTISRIESASPGVTIDQIVRAFIILGMDDDAIGSAFNAGLRSDVQQLRRRASGRLYQ